MIYDGKKSDTTDFSSNSYLQINSCGFQNVPPNYTVIRKNGRKDRHILLLTDGICRVMHNGTFHTLKPGNLVIYNPGEEQFYTFECAATSLWCHFSRKMIPEIFDTHGIKSGVYHISQSKYISEAFTHMIRNFHQPSRAKYANISLLELLYCISDSAENGEQNTNTELILPILTYINANYNKQLSLDELAKRAGYSKSRFSHIFSKVTGMSPKKYQNDLKLKTACEILTTTELSVAEIANVCGFNDVFYFSRVFKKKYNISPSIFRQKNI